MTADAQGVAMADTLPVLIANAGRYFGQDMPNAATLSKRLSDGRIKPGEFEVKEYFPDPAKKIRANPSQGAWFVRRGRPVKF